MELSLRIKELLLESLNCAQITLLCLSENLGISDETAVKIAGGFGRGMTVRKTCGAVTGAIMAIGLKYGGYRGNPEAKDLCYRKVGEFLEKFTEENEDTECAFFYTVPEGCCAEEYQMMVHQEICPKLMERAVQIAQDMLSEDAPSLRG